MITRREVEKDPTVLKFFTEKKTGIKAKTRYGYITALLLFCKYTDKMPTDIFNLHKKDLDERVPEYDQWLADNLDKFVAELIKTYHHDTIQLHVSRIKYFLKAFRLNPLPSVEIDKKPVYEDAKYALKVEDIQKAIKNNTPTYQTLIIVQSQTGLAVSDALLLDVEDFILAANYSNKSPQYWPKPEEKEFTSRDLEQAIERTKINKELIGCFDLRRKKTNNEFYTFISPEGMRSIASLLESRNGYLEPKDPIFIKDPRRISKKRNKKVFKNPRLNPFAAIDVFKRMHDEKHLFPKIKVDGKIRNYFRTHKLRKWFATQVHGEAGLSTEDTKYLMGHKTGDVLERYSNPNNYTKLKNNYSKAIPFLSINENVVINHNLDAIERISVDNAQIKKENKELTKKTEKQQEEINFLKEILTDNPYLEALKNPQLRKELDKQLDKK